jgi:hypothetical protein
MLYEHYFEGRKPSIKQVLKQVNEGIRQNARVIEVSWGENMVTLQRIGYNEHWHGSGWIKGISGYDIAIDLNKKHSQEFVRKHFAVYNIG